MKTNEILMDIGKRTDGDIYLGVVGPVRVGKSTFIKRFMELAVIPLIEQEDAKKRTIDELPQSGEGNMIMTVEPKFVPNTAVNVHLDDDLAVNIRLVDCVGYVIDGAKGYKDDTGEIRLVKTPWFLESIPFDRAAKIGTQKVIQDHSTIGIVVTSDGSITDISRESYVSAENDVISELKEIGKPFVIVVNSKNPEGAIATSLVTSLKDTHQVPVVALSVSDMLIDDVNQLLRLALYEFPLSEINVQVPKWIHSLNENHWLRKSINDTISNSLQSVSKLCDVEPLKERLEENEAVTQAVLTGLDPSSGSANIVIKPDPLLYRQIIKEVIGEDVQDKADLLALLTNLMEAKKEYDRIASALEMVKATGYGFALPTMKDIELTDPIVIKQGPRYGMRMTAKASTIHMMKVDVASSFEPIIGTKQQSEDFVEYLIDNNRDNPEAIYDCEVFGRRLGDLISEGINVKLTAIPENAREKIHDILSKIVNKGKSNVIAVVL